MQQKQSLPSECTTIIIGQEQTVDGSMIVARSEDWDAMVAKNYEIFKDTENQSKGGTDGTCSAWR